MSGNRITSIALWLVVLAGVGTLGYLWFGPSGDNAGDLGGDETDGPETVLNIERTVRNARFALEDQNPGEALELAEKVLKREPDNSRATLLAAEACAAQQKFQKAIEYYDRIPVDDSPVSLKAGFGKAAIEMYFGRASDAYAALKSVLDRRPDHIQANILMLALM